MSSSTPSPPPATADRDEFFIGWEPVPRGYRRFLRSVCVLLFIAGVTLAYLTASHQGSPGAGQWDSGAVQTFDGIVFAGPYAMLHVPGQPACTFLLVEEGKFGALERVE